MVRDAAAMQRTVNRLRGVGLIPRGVYRFREHEEADEWMTRTIAATHARLSSKTQGYVESFAGVPDDFERPPQGEVEKRRKLT